MHEGTVLEMKGICIMGAMRKDRKKILTNHKETKRAIKAAVNQFIKSLKIPDEHWIAKGNFKKGINLFWQKQKRDKKKYELSSKKSK